MDVRIVACVQKPIKDDRKVISEEQFSALTVRDKNKQPDWRGRKEDWDFV